MARKSCLTTLKAAILAAGFTADKIGAHKDLRDCQVRVGPYRHRGSLFIQVGVYIQETDLGWWFDVGGALDMDVPDGDCDEYAAMFASKVLTPLAAAECAADISNLWFDGPWDEDLPFSPAWPIEKARVRVLSSILAGNVQRVKSTVDNLREGRYGEVREKDIEFFITVGAGLERFLRGREIALTHAEIREFFEEDLRGT